MECIRKFRADWHIEITAGTNFEIATSGCSQIFCPLGISELFNVSFK
jgi:hypothetical protein